MGKAMLKITPNGDNYLKLRMQQNAFFSTFVVALLSLRNKNSLFFKKPQTV